MVKKVYLLWRLLFTTKLDNALEKGEIYYKDFSQPLNAEDKKIISLLARVSGESASQILSELANSDKLCFVRFQKSTSSFKRKHE